MQKVNSKAILKKVDEWKNTPEMVPAVYRLFVFLRWEEIPEEYKKMYDERAKDSWDDGYESIFDNVELDTEITIKAVLQEMLKRNVVAALGILPIVLADMYVKGYKTGSMQGSLMSIVKTYRDYVTIDRALAEMETLRKLEQFFKSYCAKSHMNLSFDLESAIDKIFEDYVNRYERQDMDNLEESVEKALEEYEKNGGKISE